MVEFIWLWMPWFSMNLNHWSPIAATVQIRPVVHVSIFPPPPRAFLFSSSVVFEGSPRIIRKYGVWAFRANDHWTHRQAWRLRGKTKILLWPNIEQMYPIQILTPKSLSLETEAEEQNILNEAYEAILELGVLNEFQVINCLSQLHAFLLL